MVIERKSKPEERWGVRDGRETVAASKLAASSLVAVAAASISAFLSLIYFFSLGLESIFLGFREKKKQKRRTEKEKKKRRKSLDRKRKEASNRVALTNFIEIDLCYFISFYYIDKLKSQAVRKC